jgi:hypothetical protein
MVREPVAQVRERELDPLGQPRGVRHRLRQVPKEFRHLRVALQVALAVEGEPAPRRVQRRVVAQAGEDVDDPGVGGRGVQDAVRGEDRQPHGARPVHEECVAALLAGDPVALDLDVEPVRPKRRREPRGRGRSGRRPALGPHAAHGALLVAGQRDEPIGGLGELLPRDAPLPLVRPQVRRGQEPA